jgi:hypothetical protein
MAESSVAEPVQNELFIGINFKIVDPRSSIIASMKQLGREISLYNPPTSIFKLQVFTRMAQMARKIERPFVRGLYVLENPMSS